MSYPSEPALRRTRFVLVSDTHNSTPKLPPGDVLIHAGDLTNQGSYSELQRTASWLEQADFEVKIVVAGNHDVTLDRDFYAQHGSYFHHQDVQDSNKCIELFDKSPSITYLNHESRRIELTKVDGPRTFFKVFGSPYSVAKGFWAFGYKPDHATALWDQIPLDTDVVVTHTPPKFHCDESGNRGASGCETLRHCLWRVRPKLAICGHIHEARGVETVQWDLESANIKYKEKDTLHWNDPAVDSKKQFRIDLTSRSERPLLNDGGVGNIIQSDRGRGIEVGQETVEIGVSSAVEDNGKERSPNRVALDGSVDTANTLPMPRKLPEEPFPSHSKAQRPTSALASSRTRLLATIGQGGAEINGRCDQEALSGRRGRSETCVINAAITGTSWPHKTGKRINKPIIIDIDLPVVKDYDDESWGQ